MTQNMNPNLQNEQVENVQQKSEKERATKRHPPRKKTSNPFIKGIRMFFIGVFGGGFLKTINFKKNWLFISFIILILILLIYNNLSIQSNRNKIEKLKDEKIKITTEYMKIKQKTTFLDELQGQELMERFKEEGYVQNKSLEYKILVTKEDDH